ncbi:MAG: hypothetical protein PHQ52_05990, partial [Candidatus Omnitrophica bacterium]|nr:hypothetical protein [Candidatus Omnitrophota bacterium]
MKKKSLFLLTIFTEKVFAQTGNTGYSPTDILNAADIRDIKDPFLLQTKSYFLFFILGIMFFILLGWLVKKFLK